MLRNLSRFEQRSFQSNAVSYSDRPPESDRTPSGDSPSAYNYEISQQRLRQESQEREYQRLRFEEDQLARTRRRLIVHRIVQAIAYLVGALQLLLGLRFLLRLTAANPDNTFASVIYGLSDPFVAPLSTLFVSPTFDGSTHIFDVNILVAMAAYLVLALLAIWLVRVLGRR